jgi:hypothetical protein
MVAIIASFIWLYMYTVKTTPPLRRKFATLQTLATEEGKEMVLSITLKDGTNVKYLIKSPRADPVEAARKEGISKEKVSSYELSQLGRAFNIVKTHCLRASTEDCHLTRGKS